MSDVDVDARQNVNKLLVIGFILCLIVTSLSLLVVKTCGQRNVVYTVRRCLILCLTLGILLHAVFSLVVKAAAIFADEDSFSPTCRTQITAYVYEMQYFPFVYAVGIIVLTVELLVCKTKSNIPSPLIRLLLTSIPWLVALVVALPISMAGTDWENGCAQNFTPDRLKAIYWVCGLLPPIAVAVAAIVLCFVLRTNTQQVSSCHSGPETGGASLANCHAYYYRPDIRGVVLAPPPAPQHYHNQQSELPAPQQQQQPQPQEHCYQALPPQQQQMQQQQQPPSQQQQQQQQYLREGTSQGPTQPQDMSCLPGPSQHQSSPSSCSNNNIIPQSNVLPPAGFKPQTDGSSLFPAVPGPSQPPIIQQPACSIMRDVRSERTAICVASVIYFVCTVPFPAFVLIMFFDENPPSLDEVAAAALFDTFYWLNSLRWFLMMFCWFVFLK